MPARPADPIDIDRAQYLAFSRTWAASARMSPHDSPTVEARLLDYFRALCRRIDPTVILEIGAHEASFSRWAVSEFPGARVTAFEANPHVHEKFADEVRRAGVDYVNLAVGPAGPDAVLNLPRKVGLKRRPLASHMGSLGVYTLATQSTQVTVPAARLDDQVKVGPEDRVVAWIDVEGANETVLTSGPEVLAQTHAVYVEVEPKAKWEGQWLDTDVARHLREHGLVPVARDLLVRRRHQYNVVFVNAALAVDRAVTRGAAKVLRRASLAKL